MTSGRRQRALAAWASAAGFGLVAWGLGTEAPTRDEAQQYIEQQKDLMRQRGLQVQATAARTEPFAAQRRLQNALDVLGPTSRPELYEFSLGNSDPAVAGRRM